LFSVSISKVIGVTKSLVSKIDKDLLKADKELKQVYNQIENKINGLRSFTFLIHFKVVINLKNSFVKK